MSNVIFLDIDGVLNSNFWNESHTKEIIAWLNAHDEVSDFVVLEDLDLHNEFIEKHQIKTDQTIGLTAEDVEKAMKNIIKNI